jgi:hypothetical protein
MSHSICREGGVSPGQTANDVVIGGVMSYTQLALRVRETSVLTTAVEAPFPLGARGELQNRILRLTPTIAAAS